VHIQTNESSSLRHGWFLLCGCGPPRGVPPARHDFTPTPARGTGLFYRSDRTDRQSIWSMHDVIGLAWHRRSSKLGATVAFAHIQACGAWSAARLLRLSRLLPPRYAFATRAAASCACGSRRIGTLASTFETAGTAVEGEVVDVRRPSA